MRLMTCSGGWGRGTLGLGIGIMTFDLPTDLQTAPDTYIQLPHTVYWRILIRESESGEPWLHKLSSRPDRVAYI